VSVQITPTELCLASAWLVRRRTLPWLRWVSLAHALWAAGPWLSSPRLMMTMMTKMMMTTVAMMMGQNLLKILRFNGAWGGHGGDADIWYKAFARETVSRSDVSDLLRRVLPRIRPEAQPLYAAPSHVAYTMYADLTWRTPMYAALSHLVCAPDGRRSATEDSRPAADNVTFRRDMTSHLNHFMLDVSEWAGTACHGEMDHPSKRVSAQKGGLFLASFAVVTGQVTARYGILPPDEIFSGLEGVLRGLRNDGIVGKLKTLLHKGEAPCLWSIAAADPHRILLSAAYKTGASVARQDNG
jgi:hypothetical protein